ncbi:MAG: cobalamin-binding protein [Mucilaginibacter sp.]|nr:cobalamin-binding protein [Mucilaginibacter sp.]
MHIRISAHQMELTEELQERIDLIKHKLKFIEQKSTVACIKELDPLMFWQDDELLDIAGGAAIPVLSPADWNTITQTDVDIMIVMLKGYTIEQSMKHIDHLLQLSGFANLKAVKNNRVYIADGSKYFFDNPSENKVESIELLAEIINPRQFIFGYEGEGWIKFSM